MSRSEHSCAQTREFECTKIVVPQVVDGGMYTCKYNNNLDMLLFVGLNVVEVAHDMQKQIARYVTGELGMVNSWHGM